LFTLIYGSKKKVPTGEEDYLFLYQITAMNDDCKVATIEYEHKAIKEGAEDFWSYPDPNITILIQREASHRVVEVGCERIFSIADNVSAQCRSNLNVRNYERLSLLAVILGRVYVSPRWVADEYLRRCKNRAWGRGRKRTLLSLLSVLTLSALSVQKRLVW
jgi:hypothetical protein